MSIINRIHYFEKAGVGRVAVVEPRVPWNIFMREKVLYQPSFDGAKWYLIDLDNIDLTSLLESDNAFAAMSYLRSMQAIMNS